MDIFVRTDFNDIGFLAISETSERSWVTLHTSTGPILVGVWYRPPDERREELQTLEAELEQYSPGHIGTFVFCDANVHHKRWLRFSDGNTTRTGPSGHLRFFRFETDRLGANPKDDFIGSRSHFVG